MTSRIQTQRYSATGQRPPSGARAPGELWLNLPDLRLGMIGPASVPVDLLPIRVYSPSAGYAAGDFVVNAGQLLQANAAIPPKPFSQTDWSLYQPITQNDFRYLQLAGGTMTGSLFINAPVLQISAPAGQWANLQLSRQAGQGAQIVGYTGASPRWSVSPGNQNAETGGNAGSDFAISRFSDAGAFIDAPLSIDRAGGVVNFVKPPTLAGGALPYVPLAGGNMTGTLGVGGTGISFPGLGSYWGAHHVAFGWDGTFVEVAVDGAGLGGLVLTGYIAANYLPLAGGHLTGPLTLDQGITFNWLGANAHAMSFGWNGSIQCWVDGSYVGALATQGQLGGYLPLAGGTVSGTLYVSNGRMLSYNSGNNPSLTCWDQAHNYACGMWCDTRQNLVFGALDGGGNPAIPYGAFNTGGTLYLAGNLACGNYGGTPQISLLAGASSVGVSFFDWVLARGSDGTLAWYPAGRSALFWCDPGGSFSAYQFLSYSDARTKTAIGLTDCGLDAVLRLQPVTFRRADSERTEMGFIAQDVAAVIPEAVCPMRARDEDEEMLGLSINPIVAALVNAAKVFDMRLRNLETAHGTA